jgi:carbonic anhydrase
MSVTDEYLRNNAVYAERFSGPLPLPPARHVAVVACMDARIEASPFIPHKDAIRGFVFDVATGKLNEVI